MRKNFQKAQCIGLALGSGGARGFAHLGVIYALKDAGIPVHAIAGTSMGALVGAFLAADRLNDLYHVVAKLDWRTLMRYGDLTVNRSGFLEGKALHRELRSLLGVKTFAELPLPFRAVAADVRSGEEIVMGEGDPALAIRASCCLPGMFVPVKWKERWLMDGGLVNPVPVNVLRDMAADFVIAVDVTPSPEYPLSPEPAPLGAEVNVSDLFEELSQLWREPLEEEAPRAKAWVARIQKMLDAVEDYSQDFFRRPRKSKPPSVVEILTQSVRIAEMRIARERLRAEPPDLLIRPDVGMYGTLDFDQSREIMMTGYLAARNALATLQRPARPKRIPAT